MEFILSERVSYGSGFHIVMSLSDWQKLSSEQASLILEDHSHYLLCLHTHGFRPHIHLAIWKRHPKSFYKLIKTIIPDVHVTKITSSYFETGAEIDCSRGYARVCDYILRVPYAMHCFEGDMSRALANEYLAELNKDTRSHEKTCSDIIKVRFKSQKPSVYPQLYWYENAFKELGAEQEEEDTLDRNLM